MSAGFNLKMLGSAALALGISVLSLCPETASANIVFDFMGVCNTVGCPLTTSKATGVLTLSDAYVFGTNITPADFISFSYLSAIQPYKITSDSLISVSGGLNSDGSLSSSQLVFETKSPFFDASQTEWISSASSGLSADIGSVFTFTNVPPPTPAVPEPSTWAMTLIGFAGLGYAGHRAWRKSAALAA